MARKWNKKEWRKEGRVPARILLRMREAAPPSVAPPKVDHRNQGIGAVSVREWLDVPTRAATCGPLTFG